MKPEGASNFLATAVQHLSNCICAHHIMDWVDIIMFVRYTSPAERQISFFVALEGWCTRRQAVYVRMLSAAAAAVLYSVCKYVNISTTSEFVLMAFVNM